MDEEFDVFVVVNVGILLVNVICVFLVMVGIVVFFWVVIEVNFV